MSQKHIMTDLESFDDLLLLTEVRRERTPRGLRGHLCLFATRVLSEFYDPVHRRSLTVIDPPGELSNPTLHLSVAQSPELCRTASSEA